MNGMFRIDSDFLDDRLSVHTTYIVRTYVGNGPRVSVRRMEHGVQEARKFSDFEKKSWIMS